MFPEQQTLLVKPLKEVIEALQVYDSDSGMYYPAEDLPMSVDETLEADLRLWRSAAGWKEIGKPPIAFLQKHTRLLTVYLGKISSILYVRLRQLAELLAA